MTYFPLHQTTCFFIPLVAPCKPLLTSSKLNSYLADIDLQASERLERLTEQMKQAEGITEQLKAENAMEWVQKMNNIRHRAEEIICSEIIYA